MKQALTYLPLQPSLKAMYILQQLQQVKYKEFILCILCGGWVEGCVKCSLICDNFPLFLISVRVYRFEFNHNSVLAGGDTNGGFGHIFLRPVARSAEQIEIL